jgi:hypothetical protein
MAKNTLYNVLFHNKQESRARGDLEIMTSLGIWRNLGNGIELYIINEIGGLSKLL